MAILSVFSLSARLSFRRVSAVVLLTLWGAAGPVFSDVLVDYKFDNLTPGNLIGQDEWINTLARTTPLVVKDKGMDGTPAAAANPASLASCYAMKLLPGVASAQSGIIVLEFDVKKDGVGPGTAAIAMGNEAALNRMDVYSGLVSNRWRLAGTIAVDKKGKDIIPLTDAWFRVRLTLNMTANDGNGEGKMAIKNLTKGEADFTPLYFNAEQTQDSVLLVSKTGGKETWTGWGISLGGGAVNGVSRTGLLDNVTIETPAK